MPGRKKALGAIDLPKDVFDLLTYLQFKYDCIRLLFRSPLTMIYQLDEQRKFYNSLYSTQRIKGDSDSTGGVIKTFEIFNGVSIEYIYFYNIVVKIDGRQKVIPISQMVTSKHDAGNIRDFYQKSFPDGNYPQEFVIDGSPALANGASMAFNECPYLTYLDLCFRYLNGDKNCLKENFIRTFIRVDRAHKIKSVADWKCFPKGNVRLKEFYLSAIGYGMILKDFERIKQLLLCIFVISQSKTMTDGSSCDQMFEFLTEQIRTHNISAAQLSSKAQVVGEQGFQEKKNDDTEPPSNDWRVKIFNHAIKLADNSTAFNARSNHYYCPALKKGMLRIFGHAPAWTNLMVNAFDSPNEVASSADVENSYKDLKKLIPYPLSIGMFFLTHRKNLLTSMKTAQAYLQNEGLNRVGKKNFDTGTAQKTQKISPVSNSSALNYVQNKKKHLTSEFHEKGAKKSLASKKALNVLITPFSLARKGVDFITYRITKGKDLLKFRLFSVKSEYSRLLGEEYPKFLDNEEVLCLQSPKFINDALINYWMTMKHESEWAENITFLPVKYSSYMVGELTGNRPTDVNHWIYKGVQYGNVSSKIVFLPYVLDMHWCLIVLDFQNSTFTHYDPLRWNRHEKIKITFDEFLLQCKIFQRPGPFYITSKVWKMVTPDDLSYPRQTDGFNCGVYILYIMDKIAQNSRMSKLNFQPSEYREEILDDFFSRSANNICFNCGREEQIIEGKNFKIVKCHKCSRWCHETCHASPVFAENICLICSSERIEGTSKPRLMICCPDVYSGKETLHNIRGFINPLATNSCWLNSALQILFSFSFLGENFKRWKMAPLLIDSFIKTAEEWKKNLSRQHQVRILKINAAAVWTKNFHAITSKTFPNSLQNFLIM